MAKEPFNAEEEFNRQLASHGWDKGLQREYMFHKPAEGEKQRRWRFDFAWPNLMMAVEVEGITYYGNKLGRHQTAAGYRADCEKYAHALFQGWKVLRITQHHVKHGEGIDWLGKCLSYYYTGDTD